jgi:ubiquinol-cytochrome c reductase iron-sulfur subunit
MRVARAIWRGLIAFVLLVLGRRRTSPDEAAGPHRIADPSRRELEEQPRMELAVALLLFAAGGLAACFCVLYVLHDNTQLLGVALGLALLLLAAAAIVAGKRVVPQETAVEERPQLVKSETEEEVDLIVARGGEGISRRRLLVAGVGAAGATLGAALLVPAASLGPNVDEAIEATPWRRGRRLVDEHGRPIKADDIELRSFLTAFPEGGDRGELGSPVVVVRVPPSELELPPDRTSWAPDGLLAFSKICTHAGCAVSLYRSPLYEPTSRPPALVCPCHYSTFDVRRGAEVIFGPAGRALPQLPLVIDDERNLVAGGGLSGPVGPAWLSVRRT